MPEPESEYLPWQISGAYLEDCNCEAMSLPGDWRQEGRAGEGRLHGLALGGTPELQFPWVWKESMLLGVRHSSADA
jgi:hypothetical protein